MYWFLLFFVVHPVISQVCNTNLLSNTLCHSVNVDGDLPYAESETFRGDSVFFIETSCAGGLQPRQACSVESAARANPDINVILFFTGPVLLEKDCLKTRLLKRLLNKYSNLKMYRIHMEKFSKGTPLQYWLKDDIWEGVIKNSSTPSIHTSNLLRYLTLYKFGGVYVDLDVIMVKPLSSLPMLYNWVGRESKSSVGAAILSFSNDELGKEISRRSLYVINTTILFGDWTNSSSTDIIMEVLRGICNSKNITAWSSDSCYGFEVYPEEYFYPISFINFSSLLTYEPKVVEHPRAFAYHLWNNVTQDLQIIRNSIYGHLVIKYCPTISKMFDNRKTVLVRRKHKSKLEQIVNSFYKTFRAF